MSKEKQIEEMADDLKDCHVEFCVNTNIWTDYYNTVKGMIAKGYRKQNEGKWEIVSGSNGQEKMVCTNCLHQQDLASTFTYCPNCGARMRGTIRK